MERLTDIAQGKLDEDNDQEASASDDENAEASGPDVADTNETTDAGDGESTTGDQAGERE